MRKLIVLLLLLTAHSIQAQIGIQFEKGTWTQALDKAKNENKLVFMDAYTTWCGPCKWMAANVFTDSAVAAYFNSNFVNVKMDMEKGEGIGLAKQYEVMAYPTLFVIRPDGQVQSRAIGGRSAEDFLAWAKLVTDPAYVSLEQLKVKIVAGTERNPETMRKYLLGQIAEGGERDTVFDLYRPFMQDEELLKPDNFTLFMSFPFEATSKEVEYVIANHARFAKAFPDQNIGQLIAARHTEGAVLAATNRDTAKSEMLLQRLVELPFPEAKAEVYAAKARIELLRGDLEAYALMLDEYLTLSKAGWSELNSAGYLLSVESDSKKVLTYCMKWIDASIAEERNSYNLDSKAFILYKLGKQKDAIKCMEEAIEVGKQAGDDVSESEKMLDSWKTGKS